MIHQDTRFLTWKAIVSDEVGLIVFAELNLYFIYDPLASYRPVIRDEDQGNITPEDLKREILYVGLSYFAVFFIVLVATGMVVIQREGKGVKHFFRSKFKGEKN